MKTSEICAAICNRFKQPEWSLFFEVANGTGANAKRHADAVAMNMYSSRGLSILGFEIKVSRSDLKKELENPNKAEAVAQYCNEWWLAVPKGLIKQDDLIPIPWGIMQCDEGNGKLVITKRALPLEPKPINKDFMAAILRSAGKVDEATIREARAKAYCDAWKEHQETVNREVERVTTYYRSLKEQVELFEKATGKRINTYTDMKDLAEKIKLAEDVDKLLDGYGTLQYVRNTMQNFLKETAHIGKDAEAESA